MISREVCRQCFEKKVAKYAYDDYYYYEFKSDVERVKCDRGWYCRDCHEFVNEGCDPPRECKHLFEQGLMTAKENVNA